MAPFNSFSIEAFWPLVAACIGGVFVMWGLGWEKIAEKHDKREKWDSKTESLVKWKHWKGTAGWWILMAGIAIEIADAGWTAHEINNANPRNQQITSVSAQIVLVTKGTNQFNIERLGNPHLVTLQYGRPENVDVSLPVLFCSGSQYIAGWDAGGGDPAGSSNDMTWYLQFNQKYFAMAFLPNSLVRDANEWNVFEIEARFLPSGTVIVGGKITLEINGTIREIIIPAQKAKNREETDDFLKHPTPSVSVYGW